MTAPPVSPFPPPSTSPHRLYEDALAVVLGTLFVALGIVIYAKAMLLTSSIAGAALLASYVTGTDFGVWFFGLNLPFYLLAWRQMGWKFTLRTFVAVALVTVFSRLTGQWIVIDAVNPVYAAIFGGGITGTGLLMLFRHRTGLGGINILAIFLQERFGIRAGYFQLGVDLVILAASFFVLEPAGIALSVLGAVVVNLVLAINHKPGRYLGVS